MFKTLCTALALAGIPAAAAAQDHSGHSAHTTSVGPMEAEHGEHMPHHGEGHHGEGHHGSYYHNGEDSAAAMAVVESFMEGLNNRDADAMSALVTEPSFLAMVQEMEGDDRTALRDMASVIEALAAIPVPIEEPIFDPHVMSDGLVAMVWVGFDFRVQGNLSHCGNNVFTLLKIDGEWKIATVTYSHFDGETCAVRE